jgi:hypothetical protein
MWYVVLCSPIPSFYVDLLTLPYYLGGLGDDASKVETALERHFFLANRWGCVLLLDEADVFLAERSPQDFVRNSLVAGTPPINS